MLVDGWDVVIILVIIDRLVYHQVGLHRMQVYEMTQ